MPKQLVAPVSPCHAICVEYIWTNTPAVKGQVTSSQTHGCQPCEQIWACLNLQLKIWLQILSDQVLFSKTPATQKSRHAIAHIKTQPIRPLSDSWILVFSKLLWLQEICSTLRGTGNSSSMGISSWCCSLFTFLHVCAPEIPDIRPAASPQVLFPFATDVLCQACCIILVFSLWSYCIRNPGMEEEAGWQTQVPFAATPTEAEEGAVPGWGGGISSGQSINCMVLPAHPTFVSAFCWNTCKLVIAEVFLAAKS